MRVLPTEIPDVKILEPRVFEDDRGFFYELANRRTLAEAGIDAEFVQDNLSRSTRGTLRGLHYQIEQSQGKLVTVLAGTVHDVAVDLRQSSPTFRQWVSVELSAASRRMLFIPPGFAHGFYVASETADFFYKCTDYYAPKHERTLLWNDRTIGVSWPTNGAPILSEKDTSGQPFDSIDLFA